MTIRLKFHYGRYTPLETFRRSHLRYKIVFRRDTGVCSYREEGVSGYIPRSHCEHWQTELRYGYQTGWEYPPKRWARNSRRRPSEQFHKNYGREGHVCTGWEWLIREEGQREKTQIGIVWKMREFTHPKKTSIE